VLTAIEKGTSWCKPDAIQKDRSFAVPGWHGQLGRGEQLTTAMGFTVGAKSISSPGTIPATSSQNFGCTAARGRVRGSSISRMFCSSTLTRSFLLTISDDL
jgi:hypothetical protein